MDILTEVFASLRSKLGKHACVRHIHTEERASLRSNGGFMITTLVVFLLVIVFLAFFIGKNLSNVCTFWFFKTYTDLPVAVLVFIAFAAGIVFSLILISLSRVLKARAKEKSSVQSTASDKTVADKKAKKDKPRLFKGSLAKSSELNTKNSDNSSNE